MFQITTKQRRDVEFRIAISISYLVPSFFDWLCCYFRVRGDSVNTYASNVPVVSLHLRQNIQLFRTQFLINKFLYTKEESNLCNTLDALLRVMIKWKILNGYTMCYEWHLYCFVSLLLYSRASIIWTISSFRLITVFVLFGIF